MVIVVGLTINKTHQINNKVYAKSILLYLVLYNQKVYANILESKELIENNYDIMQLSSPMLSIQAKQGIDDTFEQYSPHYNQTEMRKLMLQDGVLTVNTQDLDQRFNNIISSFSR